MSERHPFSPLPTFPIRVLANEDDGVASCRRTREPRPGRGVQLAVHIHSALGQQPLGRRREIGVKVDSRAVAGGPKKRDVDMREEPARLAP